MVVTQGILLFLRVQGSVLLHGERFPPGDDKCPPGGGEMSLKTRRDILLHGPSLLELCPPGNAQNSMIIRHGSNSGKKCNF